MFKTILQTPRVKFVISFLNKYSYLVAIFFFMVIVLEIFAIPVSLDPIFFGILFTYGIVVYLCKLPSRSTFYIALGVLFIMFVEYLLLGTAPKTEKAAVWVVLLLAFGMIHQLRE